MHLPSQLMTIMIGINLLGLSACNAPQTGSDSKNRSQMMTTQGKENDADVSHISTDQKNVEEQKQVNEPVMVAGGFLVCAVDYTIDPISFPQDSQPTDRVPVGCSLYEEENSETKINSQDYEILNANVQSQDIDENISFLKTTAHPVWDWIGHFPQASSDYELTIDLAYREQTEAITVQIINTPRPTAQVAANAISVEANCGFIGMSYRIEGESIGLQIGAMNGGCNPQLTCNGSELQMVLGGNRNSVPLDTAETCIEVKSQLEIIIAEF